MKNRDLFLPSITTLVLCGMLAFLSCAHQRAMEDGLGDDSASQESTSDEQIADGGDSQPSDSDLTELSENPDGNQIADKGDVPSDVAELEKEATTDGNEQIADNEVTPEAPKSEETDANLLGSAEPPAITPEEPAAPEVAQNTEVTPPTTIEIPAEVPVAAAPVEPAPVEAPPVKHFVNAKNSVPKIPAQAFRKKGTLLNRFYFVRKGDTAKSVANLIYGGSSKAKSLSAWNGGAWAPGKVVFYTSPHNPTDKKMSPFFQENGVSPQPYTVKRGDWISRIAKNKLGHPGSWKEIAVMNGLRSPDSIEVGQKLDIYPKDLASGQRQEPVVAEHEPEAVAPVAQRPSEPAAPVEQPRAEAQPQAPVAQQQAAAEEPEPPPAEPEKQPAAASSELDMGKMIEQNIFFIVIAAGVAVLLLALTALKKKKAKKESGDDLGEDSFSPQPKARRK